MPTNGEACLYRMTSADDTEDTLAAAEKIEFDAGAVAPDAKSHIVGFEPVLSRHDPDNPVLHVNEANRPDVGYKGSAYAVTAYFDTRDGRPGGIARLIKWFSEDMTVDGVFDEGRIGFRNNGFPELDLLPDRSAGYKIVGLKFPTDLRFMIQKCLITLQHSGRPGRFGGA